MKNESDAKEIRGIIPVVAAASETCGYCGQKRGEEDTICPNTGDAFHTWDSDPWKTEAICERKHAEAGYPTDEQARQRELALILWQLQEAGNELREIQWREAEKKVSRLRRKLTSWPVMLFKRYELARALALGWWNQLTPKEQGSIIDFTAVLVIGSGVVLFFVWMATR